MTKVMTSLIVASCSLVLLANCKNSNGQTVKEALAPKAADGADVPVIPNNMPAPAPTKFETVPSDEAADMDAVMSEMKSIEAHDYQTAGIVRRFTHAKTLACASGYFVVNADIPPKYRVGLFKEAGKTFKTFVRFSSQEKEIHADSERDNRGMAIKLLDVPGAKLLGYGDPSNLDLVMTGGNAFFMNTVKDFRQFLESNMQGKGADWFTSHPFETSVREGLLDSGKLGSLLDGNYSAMAPHLFGPDQAVRISADSCEPKTTGLRTGFDYLRDQLKTDLSVHDHCFNIKVMFFTNQTDTPVELGAHHGEWLSPKITVAQLIFPKQVPMVDASGLEFCEQLQFSPWRTLAEHQPLGGLNRLRWRGYLELGVNRHKLNGKIHGKYIDEPTAKDFPL